MCMSGNSHKKTSYSLRYMDTRFMLLLQRLWLAFINFYFCLSPLPSTTRCLMASTLKCTNRYGWYSVCLLFTFSVFLFVCLSPSFSCSLSWQYFDACGLCACWCLLVCAQMHLCIHSFVCVCFTVSLCVWGMCVYSWSMGLCLHFPS